MRNLSLYYLEEVILLMSKRAGLLEKISIDAGYEEDDDNEEDIDYSEGKEFTNKEFKELANNPPSWMKVENRPINSSGKPIEVKNKIKNKADNLFIILTSKNKR